MYLNYCSIREFLCVVMYLTDYKIIREKVTDFSSGYDDDDYY
ncbi:hypothetical protein DIBLKBHL_00017 [Camelpox virus]|nr:hypothetical protein DIBLKBHL_00017 [Camelpox virus]